MGTSKKKSGKKSKKGKSTKKRAKLPKSLRKGLPKSVADVLAAGLGALDRTQSKGTDEFQRLVEKGRTVEQRGSDAVRQASARVGSVVDETVGAARARRAATTAAVESAVEAAVRALGLPSESDVAALRAKLDRLEARATDAGGGTPPPRSESDAFRVAPHADGWALEAAGAQRALSVHGTKKAALVAARAHARSHAPSTLEILRADGSVGDTVHYDG